MVARIRSSIFADVLVLILRTQNTTVSDMSITHSVNQLKRVHLVCCSEISTQLTDRRNNSTLSQSNANAAMIVQQDGQVSHMISRQIGRVWAEFILKIVVRCTQSAFCSLVRSARATTEQVFELSADRSAPAQCGTKLWREVSITKKKESRQSTLVNYSRIFRDMIACYLALDTNSRAQTNPFKWAQYSINVQGLIFVSSSLIWVSIEF